MQSIVYVNKCCYKIKKKLTKNLKKKVIFLREWAKDKAQKSIAEALNRFEKREEKK